MPAAHGLAAGQEVGLDAVIVAGPPVLPAAAITRLHLVGDDQPAALAHLGAEPVQVVAGYGQRTVGIPDQVDHDRRRFVSALLQPVEFLAGQRQVLLPGLGVVAPVRPAIEVWRLDYRQPVGAVLGRVTVGRKLPRQIRDAVIGSLGDDNALLPADVARDLYREVVGFAAGAGEYAGLEIARQARSQAFAELDDAFMQVTRVRVQRRCLVAQRFDHLRMAVPHRDHVVITIEIFAAVGVPQRRARAAHQVQRLVVKILVCWPQRLAAARDQFLLAHFGISAC